MEGEMMFEVFVGCHEEVLICLLSRQNCIIWFWFPLLLLYDIVEFPFSKWRLL